MRQIVRTTLEAHPAITVAGETADAYEARKLIKLINPDVVTLDIEMPGMNGLDFLEKLMRLRPMPVVMVSSLTRESTSAAIRAMQLGAVSCVGKPQGMIGPADFESLPQTVLSAARARVPGPARGAAPDQPAKGYDPGRKVVLVGASTGGVEALFTVFRSFPANCPPTFVTQHIPAHFSASFAARLDANCAPRIVEAQDGLQVRPGMVVIAPGGDHHLELGPGLRCRLTGGERISGHRPSVDALFESAQDIAPRVAAALLTGMGRDGARGLGQLRQRGAFTVAQDESTSVVYGMPRAAVETGAASRVCPLHKVAKTLLDAPLKNRRARAPTAATNGAR